jgi:hypothetical protein
MSNPTASPKALVLGLRDLLHFLAAYVATAGALWISAGKPTTKAGLIALAPGVAVVLFRQLCPNVGRIYSSLTKVAPAVDPTRPSLP